MRLLTLTALSVLVACSSSPAEKDELPPAGEPTDLEKLADIAASVAGSPELTTEARVDMDALVSRVDPDNPLGILQDPALVSRIAEFQQAPDPAPPWPTPPPCAAINEIELPLVTHWDGASGSMKYLATDTPKLTCLAATLGPLVASLFDAYFILNNSILCDEWPIAPNYEQYFGQDYALYTYADDYVAGLFEDACGLAGAGVRFLRPDALEGGRLEVGSDKVQILHARQVSGALSSIFLPPGWDAKKAGGYSIFVTGAYDINANTVGYNGLLMTAAVGKRPDVIGVVWNGGSTANSVSGEERMRRQFDDIMDFVATAFGGDKKRVVITGGSRLGNIALSLSGNPDPHDYSIVYAQALFPGLPKTIENEYAWAWGSSVSSAFGGIGPYIGDPYAWAYDLDGWKYPASGAANLAGKNRYQATLEVLFGDSDADRVNAERRPYSDRFIDALLAAKTELRLEISSHDFFMENKIQLEYAQKLQARGVPAEIHYTLMGGHRDLSGWDPALNALDQLRAGVAPKVTPGFSTFQTTVAEPYTKKSLASYRAKLPFSVEHPRYTWRGVAMPLFVAAQPGTEYAIGLRRDGKWIHAFFGSMPQGETDVVRFDVPNAVPLGWYDVFTFVRYPEEPAYSLVTGTPGCEACVSDLYIGADVPRHLKQSLFGSLMLLFTPKQFPNNRNNSWGVADRRNFQSE